MISRDTLTKALHGMFEFSPTAFCISTAVAERSRYLKVNPAYLQLVGYSWDELRQQDLVGSGIALETEARRHRMHLLQTVGYYRLQEVQIRHADGHLIPTLISAQRRDLKDEIVDIEIIIDISERKALQAEYEKKLEIAARTDGLTGLPNRFHFETFMEQSIAECRASGLCLGLAFIDLNGFKTVNDGYGHDKGDQVLRILAQRLSEHIDATDFAARLGGDEFVVVFKFAPPDGLSIPLKVEQLARHVFVPLQLEVGRFHIGAAIGVSALRDTGSIETLLRNADHLMYQAKASGDHIAVRWHVRDFYHGLQDGIASTQDPEKSSVPAPHRECKPES